jgi:hypothetical protein
MMKSLRWPVVWISLHNEEGERQHSICIGEAQEYRKARYCGEIEEIQHNTSTRMPRTWASPMAQKTTGAFSSLIPRDNFWIISMRQNIFPKSPKPPTLEKPTNPIASSGCEIGGTNWNINPEQRIRSRS